MCDDVDMYCNVEEKKEAFLLVPTAHRHLDPTH